MHPHTSRQAKQNIYVMLSFSRQKGGSTHAPVCVCVNENSSPIFMKFGMHVIPLEFIFSITEYTEVNFKPRTKHD